MATIVIRQMFPLGLQFHVNPYDSEWLLGLFA